MVYFTHGEPSTYEPEPWVNMLFELKRTVPSFPPRPVWPFILAGIKRSFDAVVLSPHCAIHAETMDAVEQAVGRGDLRWYVSFLDADPPLRSAIAEAVRDGATDLILLTVFLTDSDHTAEADAMDQAMGLTTGGHPFDPDSGALGRPAPGPDDRRQGAARRRGSRPAHGGGDARRARPAAPMGRDPPDRDPAGAAVPRRHPRTADRRRLPPRSRLGRLDELPHPESARSCPRTRDQGRDESSSGSR